MCNFLVAARKNATLLSNPTEAPVHLYKLCIIIMYVHNPQNSGQIPAPLSANQLFLGQRGYPIISVVNPLHFGEPLVRALCIDLCPRCPPTCSSSVSCLDTV